MSLSNRIHFIVLLSMIISDSLSVDEPQSPHQPFRFFDPSKLGITALVSSLALFHYCRRQKTGDALLILFLLVLLVLLLLVLLLCYLILYRKPATVPLLKLPAFSFVATAPRLALAGSCHFRREAAIQKQKSSWFIRKCQKSQRMNCTI